MIKFEQGKDYVIDDESQLPFRLCRNLGFGHSGNVEKVEDITTGAVFARKKMAIRSRTNRAAIENIFGNEVKIIRGLDSHHHIVRVFATYIAKREVGLILEPVADQRDLGRFLEYLEETRLDHSRQGETIQLLSVVDQAFSCLASGLAFMHQNRIRHKDIKPQNILIHQGQVLYTDFGYSLDHTQFSNSTTEGLPDSLTRRYAAPEVHERQERNSSSDIFSLGCVYLELLAAKLVRSNLIPEDGYYASNMPSIHNELHTLRTAERANIYCNMIHHMTVTDRQQRPSAAFVRDHLLAFGTSCGQCLVMNSPSYDKSGVPNFLETRPLLRLNKTALGFTPGRLQSKNPFLYARQSLVTEVASTVQPRSAMQPHSVLLHPVDPKSMSYFWDFDLLCCYRAYLDAEKGWVFVDWEQPQHGDTIANIHYIPSPQKIIQNGSRIENEIPLQKENIGENPVTILGQDGSTSQVNRTQLNTLLEERAKQNPSELPPALRRQIFLRRQPTLPNLSSPQPSSTLIEGGKDSFPTSPLEHLLWEAPMTGREKKQGNGVQNFNSLAPEKPKSSVRRTMRTLLPSRTRRNAAIEIPRESLIPGSLSKPVNSEMPSREYFPNTVSATPKPLSVSDAIEAPSKTPSQERFPYLDLF